MAEGTSLENWQGCKTLVSSNLTLSATIKKPMATDEAIGVFIVD